METGTYYRRKMQTLVSKMLNTRLRTNNLGTIGDTTFQPVHQFFERANRECDTSRRTYNISRTKYNKIVAIGDIHGDLVALLSTLFMMGIINCEGYWEPLHHHRILVIICGDVLDRVRKNNTGNIISTETHMNPREEVDVMQYLHCLDATARTRGGRVITLLGNHEVCTCIKIGKCMGMQAQFQTNEYSRGWIDDDIKKRDKTNPITYKMNLFRPGELMAKYLGLHYPLVVRVGDFLFMHGGINVKVLKDLGSLQSINHVMSTWLAKGIPPKSVREQTALLDIVWDRQLSDPRHSDVQCATTVKCVFDRLGMDWEVGGVVVGHTIQPNLQPRCKCKKSKSAKVWRVDLALSEAFGEPKSIGAIEIAYLKKPRRSFVKTTQCSLLPPHRCRIETYINGQKKNVYKQKNYTHYHECLTVTTNP